MADNVKIGYSRRIHKKLQAFLFNLMGQTSSYDKYIRRYGFFKKACFITTRVDRPLVVLLPRGSIDRLWYCRWLRVRPSVRSSVRPSVRARVFLTRDNSKNIG